MVQSNEAETATLTLPDGKRISLPYLSDASGAGFVDVRALFNEHKICTFDPGFNSTASCQSRICWISGQQGKLQYRGYPIEQLADPDNGGDFVQSCYLLINGQLPDDGQRQAFIHDLTRHTMVPEPLIQFYKGFRHDAAPMAVMVGVVGALAAFYDDASDVSCPQHRDLAAIRIIAKMPTLAAIAYKTSIGQPIIYPRNHLSYVENFMSMMFAVPAEPYELSSMKVWALELFIILHMDHEQNASTSTVRTAGSSQANPYACIASGIATLWGPAHGGANEAVIKMLRDIGSKDRIPAAIARAKDKSDSFRLMGFGHREDPMLQIAVELEKIATSDEYFVSRGLYPNVDFFSGIVLRALGIPESMFTVLFAVARSVGWIVQWKEMASEAPNRISRPRQMYMGELDRHVAAVAGGATGGAASAPTRSVSTHAAFSGQH